MRLGLARVALAAALALAAPATAQAASVTVNGPPGGAGLLVGAGNAAGTDIAVSLDAQGRVVVSTTSDPLAGTAECPLTASAGAVTTVTCGPASDYTDLGFGLTAGDDTLVIAPDVAIDADALGGAGTDRLTGGAGADNLDGGPGDDSVAGGPGADVLVGGGTGDDVLDGGPGADTVSGGPGADALAGGDGADALTAGAGADSVDGGPGRDSIDVEDAPPLADAVTCDAEDLVRGWDAADDLAGCTLIRPAFAAAPAITGRPAVGEKLSLSLATLGGTAATVTKQWSRCAATGECVPIAGATGEAYAVDAADAGARLRVRVTAVNAAGRAVADSASTAVVSAAAAAGAPSSLGGSMTTPSPGDATAAPASAPGAARASGFPPDLIATVRPATARAARRLEVRVSALWCNHSRCTATVVASGPASTVKVVLRRGARALFWTRRPISRRPMRVSLTPHARLRAGRYTVVATAGDAPDATKTVRRAITVR
jgi:hypothetical protein